VPPSLFDRGTALVTFAHVFPGQGSQSVGMGRALAESSADAREVWDVADAALGEPLSTLAWSGPADELDLTANAQPALLAASIASHRALQAAWRHAGVAGTLAPRYLAGHSMGQYSAMVAAGVIDLADGIRLVRERGRLMQASSDDGAMAAVIGLDDSRLAELEAAGAAAGIFTIANRNSPGQVVVSGERRAVEAAAEAARSLGAKRAILLPVSVAAHSPLMAGAAQGMRRALEGIAFRDPSAPLLANADARPLTTGEACRDELVEHLTAGVDWVRAVERMAADGVDAFVETGPGKVLTGLVKRIAPAAQALATDDPAAEGALAVPFLTTPAPAPAQE
jgi:[acyl-carrier-protein] S-malonyltransferase